MTNYILEAVIKARDEFSSTYGKIIDRVEEGTKRAAKTNEFFSGSLVAMTAKFSILEHGIRRVVSMLGELATPFKIVEEFNQGMLRLSALLMGMGEFKAGTSIAGQLEISKGKAQALYDVFVKIDPEVQGTLNDIIAINEVLVQSGIVLDQNNRKQVEGFRNVANAAYVIAKNYQNYEMQLRQEVRALAQGTTRVNDILAGQIQATLGAPFKAISEEWKRQGVWFEKIGELLKGFDAISGEIQLTWAAISSSISTTFQVLLRDAFKEGYKEVNKFFKDSLEIIKKHGDDIKAFIGMSWEGIKNTLKEIAIMYNEIFGPTGLGGLSQSGNFFKDLIKSMLYMTNAVFPAVLKVFNNWITLVKEFLSYLFELGKGVKAFFNPFEKFDWDKFKAGADLQFLKLRDALGKAFVDVDIGKGFQEAILKIDKAFEGSINKMVDAKKEIDYNTKAVSPDPEAVKKWNEWKESMGETLNKMDDPLWGKWWNTWQEGFKKLTAAKGSLEEFRVIMTRLWDETQKKEDIATLELREKALLANKDDRSSLEEAVRVRQQIMRMQNKDEMEIRQYGYEKLAEISDKSYTDEIKKALLDMDNRAKIYRREGEFWKQQMMQRADLMAQRIKDEEDWTKKKEDALKEMASQEDYLFEKTGKYYADLMAVREADLISEKEALRDKYGGIIDLVLLEEYYAQKIKDVRLDLREKGLKWSQDVTDGWAVALERQKENLASWAQAANQIYKDVTKSMETTFSDFIFDAFTGKLKSATDYFRAFAESIARAWANLLAKMAAEWMMTKAITQIGGLFASGNYGYGNEAAGLGQQYAHGGGRIMHGGGMVPIFAEHGEYMIRKNSVNDRTLPALQEINGTGDTPRSSAPGNTVVQIFALDSTSFAEYLNRNRGALDAVWAGLYSSNSLSRKVIRGQA